MNAGAAILFWLIAAPRADDGAAADQFLHFASNGCVNAIVTGTPVSTFAAQNEAKSPDDKIASAILGKDDGRVYWKDDPVAPIAIAQRTGGPCTVNARFSGDVASLTEAVTDFFGGPGGGFYVARVFEESAGAAGWTTHHVFVGRRRGKKMTLLFSATPGAQTMDQLFFAAQESKE
ncbi:MAG: hypothetical protein AB7E79_02370 [Rhodospirillaceae bacterium]